METVTIRELVQSGLGRLFWKQEIGGSNPPFPTIKLRASIKTQGCPHDLPCRDAKDVE